MIRVMMDSNEQNSQRAKDLERIVKDHSDVYIWDGFKELPVDVRCQDICSGRYVSIELKEPADMVASVLGGHLAQQVTALQSAQEPAMIAVLGSMYTVFREISPMAGGKYRGKDLIQRDFGRITDFCATSFGEGYPVFFWDINWASMMLHHVQKYFKNGSICEFLKKDKNNPVAIAMLCMIPGVGASTAEALIKEYDSISVLTMATIPTLAETKINGKKLGKKAEVIWKALNGRCNNRCSN